jgi:hypothetical protein
VKNLFLNSLLIAGVCLAFLSNPSGAFANAWYVDNAVDNSGDGQSWGTAWKTFSDINWSVVQPGHSIYISGGATSKTYTDPLILTAKNGSAGSPITVRPGSASPSPTGHSGKVVIINASANKGGGYGILVYRSYIIVNGNSAADNSGTRNLRVTGSYSAGINLSGSNSRISYLEIDNNGLLSKASFNTDGVLLEGINSFNTREIDHNLIHDNWQDGIAGRTTNDVEGYGQLLIHHNEIYNVADDGMEVSGNGIDVYNNTIHKMYYFGPDDPRNRGRGHPDPIALLASGGNPLAGIKGGYARIWNNLFYDWGEFDHTGQGIYLNALPDDADGLSQGSELTAIRIINNVAVGYRNPNAVSGSLGITFSPQAPKGGWFKSITDVIIANNTLVGFTDDGHAMNIYPSAMPADGNNPVAYDPTIVNFFVLNNIIHDTGKKNWVGLQLGRDTGASWGLAGWGASPTGNIIFDYNVYSPGPAGGNLISWNGDTGPKYDYPQFKALNGNRIYLPQRYTGNLSEMADPLLNSNADYSPTELSVNVIDKGRNLATLPNYVASLDSIFLADRLGNPRGAGVAWDVGAFEFARSSTTPGQLTFSSTFECISVKAAFSGDDNGNNSASIRFRKVDELAWKDAYAPIVDRRTTISGQTNPYVNQARGSIVGLQAGTAYEVEVTFSDPDGTVGSATLRGTVTTIAPTPPLSGAILYVDDVTTNGNGSSASPFNSIPNALNAASAGTTILVRQGTYPAFTASKSGTTSGYIAIVGESRDQVFIEANTNTSISVNGDFIQLKNLRLKKPGHYGILVNGHHHVWIENIYLEDLSVSMSYGDAGVSINNANDVYVLNSQILSPSMTAMPAASPRYDSPGEGIYIGAGVRNLIIKGNNIDGGFRDGIGNSPEGWGGGAIDNSDIAYNTVTNSKDDSIQIEGDDVNLRIYGNVVNANDGYSAVALQPSVVGPVYVFRNVLQVTASYGGTAFKVHGTGYEFYFHNTIETTLRNEGFSGPVNVTVYNNIFKTEANPLYSPSALGKYNANLYAPRSGYPIVSRWNGSTTNYYTIAEFHGATGNEQKGRKGDPQFIDSAKRIDSASPAFDAGIILANFNDADSAWPYSGTAPDMGAHEFNSTPTVDSDSDGLLDSWEIQHFGSISDSRAQPGLDPDNDGFTNLEEQDAGTSPIDSLSRLIIINQGFSTNSFYIEWTAASNKVYKVDYSTTLTNWFPAVTITNSSATTLQWTDDGSLTGGMPSEKVKRFYRVKVP